MRIFHYLLLFLVVLVVAAWLALRQSLPTQPDTVTLSGLQAPASLRYDAWQRPYVQAESLADALAVQGWLHARHRLWQMEMLRRAGQGRLAQLLGGDLLETDQQLWRAGVPQLAERLQANASPDTLVLVDAYIAGVNQAIEAYSLLPPELLLLQADRPRWQRRDVFALGALMAYQSANNMSNELLRLALARVLDPEQFAVFMTDDSERGSYPFVLAPLGSLAALGDTMDALDQTDPAINPLMPRLGFGSNGWVVSGERSTTGAPLYAFDSHDDLGLPNLFYEVHLFIGQGRQLRGWSVAGLPGVINGFNENIAWGFTNIGDTQDLFLETRSEEDPRQFLDGDQWYRAEVETVSIPVRGEADHKLEILHTRNGPLVSEEPPLSLAWTVHRIERPSLDSMLGFNLAQDWASFTAALDAFPAPTLNATYADRHGTIGFRTGGVLPLRGRGVGLVPQDGSDPASRWQGLVPAGEMPQRSNPEAGFLAAANARVNAPGDGPLVSADNAAPYRIARIQEVLSSGDKLSPEDMRALQMDWTDGQAQMLLPTMLRDLQGQALGSEATTARDLLQAWSQNPQAAADSAAALIFQRWYLALAEGVFSGALGELYTRLLRRAYLLNHALDHLLLHGESSPWWGGKRASLLAESLQHTVDTLSAELGSDPRAWRLDQLQHVQLHHELGAAIPGVGDALFNEPNKSWGGSVSTVGRARYSYSRPFAVDSGATVRAVASMGEVPEVQAVIPGGQSGHPLSEHYADQYPHWLAGELLPIATTPDKLASPITRLLPGGEK